MKAKYYWYFPGPGDEDEFEGMEPEPVAINEEGLIFCIGTTFYYEKKDLHGDFIQLIPPLVSSIR